MAVFLKRDLIKLILLLFILFIILISFVKVFPDYSRKIEGIIGLEGYTDKLLNIGNNIKNSTKNVKIENIGNSIKGGVNTQYVQ